MALYSSREILPNLGNLGQSDPIDYLAQNKQLRNPNFKDWRKLNFEIVVFVIIVHHYIIRLY